MSNRSKTRPASRSGRASRPGAALSRTPATSDTESGAAPTGRLQASVLGTWAANRPELQVEQGPWEPVTPGPQDEGPDESTDLFDPDLAFGRPAADPPMPGAMVDGGVEYPSAEPTSPGGSTGSSRGDGAVPNPLAAKGRAKALGKLGSAGFAAVSGLLNERLAVDEDDETWLAEKAELEAIEGPSGRLLSRKLPISEGTDATDLADLIELGIITAGYFVANAVTALRRRRVRRRQLAGVAVHQES